MKKQNLLQFLVNKLRLIFPRGWSIVLKLITKLIPSLKTYKAYLLNSDYLYIDLSSNMCQGYFFYGGHPHENGTDRFFLKYIKPGFCVMDIGANVGYYTRLASKLVGSGSVISFEPLPKAYKLLKKNSYDLKNTEVFNCALSSDEGNGSFFIRDSGDTSSLLRINDNEKLQEIKVSIKTADSFIDNINKVDFVKIDVEGFEMEVLQGMTTIISKYRPIIIFEYLTGFGKIRGLFHSHYVDFFNKYDYSLHYVNNTGASVFTEEVSPMIAAMPFEK
jgi:FkbM family methyltransferase